MLYIVYIALEDGDVGADLYEAGSLVEAAEAAEVTAQALWRDYSVLRPVVRIEELARTE